MFIPLSKRSKGNPEPLCPTAIFLHFHNLYLVTQDGFLISARPQSRYDSVNEPPPGVKSDFVNPVTLAHSIVAISATTSVLAVALLLVRLYSTLRITRSASYDDGASVLALVFSLAYVG